MCRLGGEFAGILRIEIPAEKKSPLLAALQKISGLNVVIQPDPKPAPATPGRQTKLEIVGSDRPGIVREITSALARAGVNVEEFSSEVVSAPMSGETLFKAECAIAIARRLRSCRVEKGSGKNRRRSACGCFVCGNFRQCLNSSKPIRKPRRASGD